MAITGLTEEVKAYLSGMNPRKVSSKPAPVTATLGNDSAQANPSFTPTSSLDDDPMKYRYISYPRDVTQDMANGHYMLFYVNVQNRAKFQYTNPYGTSLSTTKQVEESKMADPVKDFINNYNQIDCFKPVRGRYSGISHN